jgi:PiT family inorganic phosphate transporter
VTFLFLSPIIGMILAIILTIITSWMVRRQRPQKVDRWFRRLQLLSAALFSLGHGTNDARRWLVQILLSSLLGHHLLSLSHSWRHHGRRLAHH